MKVLNDLADGLRKSWNDLVDKFKRARVAAIIKEKLYRIRVRGTESDNLSEFKPERVNLFTRMTTFVMEGKRGPERVRRFNAQVDDNFLSIYLLTKNLQKTGLAFKFRLFPKDVDYGFEIANGETYQQISFSCKYVIDVGFRILHPKIGVFDTLRTGVGRINKETLAFTFLYRGHDNERRIRFVNLKYLMLGKPTQTFADIANVYYNLPLALGSESESVLVKTTRRVTTYSRSSKTEKAILYNVEYVGKNPKLKDKLGSVSFIEKGQVNYYSAYLWWVENNKIEEM